MKIQLKELFDIVGEAKKIDYEIDGAVLGEYSSYSFAAPIAVKGLAENRAGVVTLKINVSSTMNLVCDRCLDEFTRDYVFSFEHTLVRSVSGDNDEYVVCENNILDLDELVMSDFILQLPTKILCREECRGLCSICGQNLNKGSCECSGE